MRINVYAEEITGETELVTKIVDEGTANQRTFYGVRCWLASPPQRHVSPDDDDRWAVTFWVPWTRARGHQPLTLHGVLADMAEHLKGVPTMPMPSEATA